MYTDEFKSVSERREAAERLCELLLADISAADLISDCDVVVVVDAEELDLISRDRVLSVGSPYSAAVNIDISVSMFCGNRFDIRSNIVRFYIIVDYQLIAGLLMQIDVLFCFVVVFEGTIVVEVLLVEIQENCLRRLDGHIFKLVAGELADNNAVRLHIVSDLKNRDTDVSGNVNVDAGLFQNVENKGSNGTLALGSGNADYLFTVNGEELLSLARNRAAKLRRVLVENYSRALENNVEVIKAGLVVLSGDETDAFRQTISFCVNGVKVGDSNFSRRAILY